MEEVNIHVNTAILVILLAGHIGAAPSTDYSFVRQFGQQGTISESNKFIAMAGIAVDRFEHVFVTDVYEPGGDEIISSDRSDIVYGNQSVKRWSNEGQFQLFWQNTDVYGGHQFGPARGIDCACNGDPFYCAPYDEWYGANIEHSTPDGTFLEEFPDQFWYLASEFIFRDVAISADGHAYGIVYRAKDSGSVWFASVMKFSWTGTNWAITSEASVTNEWGLSDQPWGIDTDTWRNKVYVSLLGTNGMAGIRVYDLNLNRVNDYQPWSYAARPEGVAVDERDGTILISETVSNMIYTYSADGIPIVSFGGTGAEPSQFNNPVDLDIDMNGWLYVADAGNYRIQVFAPPEQGNLNFMVYKSKVKVGWKQKTKGLDRDLVLCKAIAAIDVYTNITGLAGMPFSFWLNDLEVIPEMAPTKTNTKRTKALYAWDTDHKAKVQYRPDGALLRITVKLKRGNVNGPLNIMDTTPLPPWLWATAQMTLSNEYLGVHHMRLQHLNKVGKVYKAWKK